MALVMIDKGKTLTKQDFEKAHEDYQSYIKITTDIENGTVVLGGEYHADAEKLLLEAGSKQKDIWGGGVNLETKSFETNAIINLRSGRNNSTEILDKAAREKFINMASKVFKKYVR